MLKNQSNTTATGVVYEDNGNNNFIAAQAGMPAITVPMGFSTGNLPAGMQFMGLPFDDVDLLRIAYQYEQATHRRIKPTLLRETD